MQPNGRWHIHDGKRPQPKMVTPGATPGAAPADATVLLGSGTDASAWKMTAGGAAVTWPMKDGILQSGKGMIETKAEFTDFQLHVEFATPKEVKGDGQGRGNSGVFLLGQFEVQVLDSYQNPTYPDGQASAMYGQYPPLVNASRPPGEWQAYDIIFTAPRFNAAGTVEKPAVVTVIHNGIVVHNATRLPRTDRAQDHQAVSCRPRRRARSDCRITGTPCTSGTSGSGRSRGTTKPKTASGFGISRLGTRGGFCQPRLRLGLELSGLRVPSLDPESRMMSMPNRRLLLGLGIGALLLTLTWGLAGGGARTEAQSSFAAQVAALSEPAGYFDTDNLISNERSYLDVVPDLKKRGVRGGAYIGVGPDQNFSYIAAVRPEIVVHRRRQARQPAAPPALQVALHAGADAGRVPGAAPRTAGAGRRREAGATRRSIES